MSGHSVTALALQNVKEELLGHFSQETQILLTIKLSATLDGKYRQQLRGKMAKDPLLYCKDSLHDFNSYFGTVLIFSPSDQSKDRRFLSVVHSSFSFKPSHAQAGFRFRIEYVC